MNNATLERQSTLNLHIPRSVAIVGVGGVGSWVALFLALAGIPELWLWDGDTVSEHNLNRLPVAASTVGKRKSDAVAEEIKRLRPDCTALALPHFNPDLADSLGMKPVWAIAATDSLATRRMVHEWAVTRFSYSYMEAAAEGEWGSITDSPADWSTPDEENPGYASVPVHVGPCVAAANLIAYHLLHNTIPYGRTIRMGWNTDQVRFECLILPPYKKEASEVTNVPAAAEEVEQS